MKKHFRVIVAVLSLGVLLFAAFILAVNLYVQSMGIQNRLRTALSQAVGMPVGVFRTTFSPWGGFRLDQIKITSDLPRASANFLTADCLEVRCEFIPLLQGRIVIRRVALDAPQFVFQKNDRGQFRFPRHATSMPIVVAPSARVPPRATLPEVTHTPIATPTPATAPAVATAKKAPLPDADIRKLLLRDGTFRFLAQDGSELIRLEMVRCSLNARTAPGTFIGVLEIKKAVILNRWEIANLEAAVTVENHQLHIQKLAADMGEGRLEGGADADLAAEGQPYSVHFRLSKGELGKFFPEDSDMARELVGMVHARLEYEGFATQEDKNKGHAELKISKARVTHLPILELASQLMRSDDLKKFSIRKTEIKADITGPLIHITPSAMESDHMKITFSGPVDARQNLDLRAQLLLDEALFKKLPSEARENFVKQSDSGQQALDFAINGTLSAPESNFVNRLIGEKLQKKFKNFLGNSEPTPKK
ncbi:MAG: AsmA-like C-terminal region-containing protein [Chthoniobacterales bacterium]